MPQKVLGQFKGTDLIPFRGYSDYLDRNIPPDLSKEPITLTLSGATALGALHYGIYIQPLLWLGAIAISGLEKLIS